jgi:hypothetical protein
MRLGARLCKKSHFLTRNVNVGILHTDAPAGAEEYKLFIPLLTFRWRELLRSAFRQHVNRKSNKTLNREPSFRPLQIMNGILNEASET